MRLVWLGILCWVGMLPASPQEPEINVNSRYTIERLAIAGDGWRVDVSEKAEPHARLSAGLRREMHSLIGEKLDPSQLDDLAKRIRREFHARTVSQRVLRGASPEYVQVVFELRSRPARFEVSVPKFLYNSQQGWTGAVEGTITAHHNGLTFGLLSDGDELAERYAGLVARYENNHLGTDRLGLRFEFNSFHEQWNRGTREVLDGAGAPAHIETSGLYRTRQNFQPTVRFMIAKPLTLTVGASFQRSQSQFPAAHTEAANALITTLRFHRRWEGPEVQQDLDAGYSLRAATNIFDSDYIYARHRLEFRYALTHGRHTLLDVVSAGLMSGRAPLFERFVMGNSSTLRGWNKFDIDPLGGNRAIHNTVEYRYGIFQVFYDAGSVWDRGQNAAARHSVGVGLHQGNFSLAVAFPVKEGHAEPIFMVGMNY